MKRFSQLLGTLFVLTYVSDVRAEELDFRTLYIAQSARTSINIDVADDDVLVFSAGPPIILHGKRLVIAAKIARLGADLTIQQFDESDDAGPSEKVGDPGSKGALGRRSSGRNGAVGHPGGRGRQDQMGRRVQMRLQSSSTLTDWTALPSSLSITMVERAVRAA